MTRVMTVPYVHGRLIRRVLWGEDRYHNPGPREFGSLALARAETQRLNGRGVPSWPFRVRQGKRTFWLVAVDPGDD